MSVVRGRVAAGGTEATSAPNALAAAASSAPTSMARLGGRIGIGWRG